MDTDLTDVSRIPGFGVPAVAQWVKNLTAEVPVVSQQSQTQLASMRIGVQSLALLSGLRIQSCHELWCRLQTQLHIRPLVWEPPYAVSVASKKERKQERKKARKQARKNERKKEGILGFIMHKEGRKKGREGGREEERSFLKF